MADSQSAGSCTQAHCRQRNTGSGRDICQEEGALQGWESFHMGSDGYKL